MFENLRNKSREVIGQMIDKVNSLLDTVSSKFLNLKDSEIVGLSSADDFSRTIGDIIAK